jgi:hypothetical protein
MHVKLFAEHLLDRPNEAGMAPQQAERLVVGMRGEGGARRAGLFAPDLLAVGGVNRLGLVAQDRDLGFGETAGQKEITVVDELAELLRGERYRDCLRMRRRA